MSATEEEPLQDAFDRMLARQFSQLPVLRGNGQHREFYFITYESILVALHNFGSRIESSRLRVADALVRVLNVYRETDDLFDLLVGMREMNAALIVDDDRNLKHIVTSYDTSLYFQQWAEDMMHVRDVEHSLRRIINCAFKRSDGEIDEEARQSAIAEITSENRKLRKKFGVAVRKYLEKQAKKAMPLNPELADVAFSAFLKGSSAAPAAGGSVLGAEFTQSGESSTVEKEADIGRQLFASQALRARFHAALLTFLDRRTTPDPGDDALIEEAFIVIYDRNEQVKQFGELTLGEYVQLFFDDVCWGRCKGAIHLNEEDVEHMLKGVSDTRNDLAHFRDEQVTAQKRAQLKRCANWLSERERPILKAFEDSAAPGVPTVPDTKSQGPAQTAGGIGPASSHSA
jgi:hypothetical protein